MGHLANHVTCFTTEFIEIIGELVDRVRESTGVSRLHMVFTPATGHERIRGEGCLGVGTREWILLFLLLFMRAGCNVIVVEILNGDRGWWHPFAHDTIGRHHSIVE